MNDSEIFELDGLTFKAEIADDDAMGPPWKEHDGHGVVSDWCNFDSNTNTSDRVLCAGDYGRSVRYYEMTTSYYKAENEGWGISDEERQHLTVMLGREPTAEEVLKHAVELDFLRLQGWCEGRWEWVGVVVTLLDVDGNPTDESESLWGIESDAGDYLNEVAKELAAEIARRVGHADTIPARPSSFRIRPEPNRVEHVQV